MIPVQIAKGMYFVNFTWLYSFKGQQGQQGSTVESINMMKFTSDFMPIIPVTWCLW